MEQKNRKTGIDIIGDVSWGTHLCQFYRTKEDLIDIIVPYFKTGLENNELCMWITSEPLGADEAKASLRKAVSNLDDYMEKGQIEILDYNAWYTKSGKFDAGELLQGWIEKEKQALDRGFDGLRITGNTYCLEKKEWRDFIDYEALLDSIIFRYLCIAICSYSLDKCGLAEVIDITGSHRFALIRQTGQWRLIENAETKQVEGRWKLVAEIADASGDGLVATSMDGKVIYVNRAYVKMTGYESSELIGMDAFDLAQRVYKGEDSEKASAAVRAFLEGKVITELFLTLVSKESQETIITFTISFMKDTEGQPVAVVIAVKDVTEHMKLEKALRKSENKYRGLLEELNAEKAVAGLQGRLENNSRAFYGVVGYCSVKVASQKYGLSQGRIRQLLQAKRLIGRKFGNAWAVSITSLENYIPFPQKAPKTKKRRESS